MRLCGHSSSAYYLFIVQNIIFRSVTFVAFIDLLSATSLCTAYWPAWPTFFSRNYYKLNCQTPITNQAVYGMLPAKAIAIPPDRSAKGQSHAG
jgi:hypothetical protein